MENKNIFELSKGLQFLCFIAGFIIIMVSTAFTAVLFESFASGTYIGKAFMVVGVCVNVGQAVMLPIALSNIVKGRYALAGFSSIFYICCLSISIIASQSLDLNKANEIKQETMLNSDEYKRNVETYEDSKKTIARLESEIQDLKNNKESKIEIAISPLLSKRAYAKSKNWLTTPKGSPRDGVDVWDSRIANKKIEVSNNIENQIKSKQTEIGALNNLKLSTKKDLENLKESGVMVTEGMISFAEQVHENGFGQSPTDVLSTFYLIKNIFIELLGTFLLMIPKINNYNIFSKTKKNKENQRKTEVEKEENKNIPKPKVTYVKPKTTYVEPKILEKKEENEKVKSKATTNKTKNNFTLGKYKFKGNSPTPQAEAQKKEKKIGFDTSSVKTEENKEKQRESIIKESNGFGFTSKEIQIYLNYMYKTQNNGISQGYTKIANATGLTVKIARYIKTYLEQQGLIRTEGKRTIILK